MVEPPKPVTLLLQRWRAGDQAAMVELAPLIYEELRRQAASYMRRERSGHSLSPTDLVSEAFLRLVGAQQFDWRDRMHFFAAAARHMRLVLVDHARARGAAKRGGARRPVTLDDNLLAADRSAEVIALHEALEALTLADERKARIIELHFFAGLSLKEIGEVLDIHHNTVLRDLRFAEAWLNRHLSGATRD